MTETPPVVGRPVRVPHLAVTRDDIPKDLWNLLALAVLGPLQDITIHPGPNVKALLHSGEWESFHLSLGETMFVAEEILRRMKKVLLQDTDVFVCPGCAKASSNPIDLQEGYCGHCKAYTGQADYVGLHQDHQDPNLFRVLFHGHVIECRAHDLSHLREQINAVN